MTTMTNPALPESQQQIGFIRMRQLVPGIVPVSKATLWLWVANKTFPAPVKLGPAVTAWRLEDVRRWQAAQK